MPVTRSQSKKESKKCLPIVKGFKLMGKDMRGYKKFQYRLSKTYSLPDNQKPIMCENGFHFCEKAKDCLQYVPHLLRQRPLRLFRVEAQDVAGNDKKVSKTITIKKEVKDLSFLSGKITHSDGSVGNYVNFTLHSENDEPSLVSEDGLIKEWHVDGKLERGGDKPAYHDPAEDKWFKAGKLHRDGDKPAIVCGGDKEWYVNDVPKRQNPEDPTCIDGDGTMYWNDENGYLHRENGKPALIYPDGYGRYYTHGVQYNE